MALSKLKALVIYFILFSYNVLIKSWNLFRFPIYSEDEGTYVSQAHALWELGELSYYTYWYDHAPVGWVVISLWQKLLDFMMLDFGNSLNDSRVFMMLVSTYILWCIVKILDRFQVSNLVKYLVASLYIFSPLTVYFQRIIFLDNLMIAFLLTSILLFLETARSKCVVLSAIVFGLAVLTKESAIFFLPFFLFYGWKHFYRDNRKMLFAMWLMFFVMVVAQYPTFALLKGELLPKSIPLLGNPGQVSLTDAIFFQNSRSENFWDIDSALRYSMQNFWLKLDSMLIATGLIGMIYGVLAYFWNKKHHFVWLLGFSYIFYLLRWRAQEWYIIPLIPVSVISMALLLERLKSFLPKALFYVLIVIIFVAYVPINVYNNRELFVEDITQSQIAAVQWARQHITGEGITVIDNYAFLELNDPTQSIENQKFHYFWKVEKDPEIREDLIQNSHQNIDYVLMTQAMEEDFAQYDFDFLVSYIAKAELVTTIGDLYPIKVYSIRKSAGL